jgi:hypothetical protein
MEATISHPKLTSALHDPLLLLPIPPSPLLPSYFFPVYHNSPSRTTSGIRDLKESGTPIIFPYLN